MSFLSVLLALLIEQARPLARGNPVHAGLRAWVRGSLRHLDAGTPSSAWLAWSAAVLVPGLIALLIDALLRWQIGGLAAFVWHVAVLYATLGFRQFSFHFTGLRDALDAGDEDEARQRLARWRQVDTRELPRTELLRQVIEHSVLSAHRHVFGVLGWYSVLAVLGLGPAGAVLYRLAELVPRYWAYRVRTHGDTLSAQAQAVAQAAWGWVDWLPARASAIGFAVVGSFEDAIDGWRRQVREGAPDNDALIIAATGGAIGVQLAPGASGGTPQFAHLQSLVGLVWRTVVLWLVLIALLTLANLLG